MRRQSTAPVFVSRNHLEGSFSDVPLDSLLAACFRHLVTGAIDVAVGGVRGRIELRAGAVDRAEFDDLAGARALDRMRNLVDGFYEVTQRLPDLTGELGGSAVCEGDVEGVPLIALMRHCEHHALTCTITVVSRFDRAQIEYHAGEIKRVELNGFYDDDAIVAVLDWKDARFRVTAPALDLDIQGWPRVRRAPTSPFALELARGTSPRIDVLPERDARDPVVPAVPRVAARKPTRDPTMHSLPPPPPEPAVIGAQPASGKPWAAPAPAPVAPPPAPAEEPALAATQPAMRAATATPAPAPARARTTEPPRALVLPAEDVVRHPAVAKVGRKRRALRLFILFALVLAAGLTALVFLLG